MKKIKIAALGLAALVTGVSAFTPKHATGNKFATTFYVVVTNAAGTQFQLTTSSPGSCHGTAHVCSFTKTVNAVVTKTSSQGAKTWIKESSTTTKATRA